MSNIDEPTETAKGLVPTPSSSQHLRRSTSGHRPVGQPQQGVTPQFVLYVLRRWWMIAGPLGLVLAGIAVSVVFVTFEKQYEASTWLRISSHQPYLAYAPSHAEGGGGALFVQTQVEMIRSPLVLGPVMGLPEAADVLELQKEDDPVGWLAKNIKVSPVGKSELFKISLTCANPKDSAWIVNAVAHEYFLLLGQNDAERTREVISTLTEEKAQKENEVKRLRENLRERTKQLTGQDPFSRVPTMNPDLHHPIAELNSRLISAKVDQQVLTVKIAVAEDALAEKKKAMAEQQAKAPESTNEPESTDEGGLIDEAIERDPEVQQLEGQIALSQARLDNRESNLADDLVKDDVVCEELREAIHEDEELLDERRAVVRKRFEARLASSPAALAAFPTVQLEKELAAMKSELAGLEITETLLTKLRDEKRDKAQEFSGDTLELHFLESELAEADGVFAVLSDRILRLTTEQRAPDQVKLLRSAEEAAVPVVKFPYPAMALASLLFFVPFGLAGVWEFLVKRVNNSQQLEESAHLTVIGEIAQLPVRRKVARNGSKRRVDRGLTVFEESIDGLRTHLMLSDRLTGMKVLAVTSAAEDEGKTSVAAQLAVNIAWVSGKPTLLIDGDMRSPDVHNVFDIPPGPGLAEILSTECSLEEAIVKNEANFTDVLPAGKLRTNPNRLLGNGVFSSFLKEVRSEYDYIIIDTPPILAASEALVLAKMADTTLMCAMKDSSRIDQVKKAHERLAAAEAHPVGIVLNGVPTGQYLHRYGAYAYSHD